MQVKTIPISGDLNYITWLAYNKEIKEIIREYTFHSVSLRTVERSSVPMLELSYPKGNVYWVVEFIEKMSSISVLDGYEATFKTLLENLKTQVVHEHIEVQGKLEAISAEEVVRYMSLYNLRDYQAFDLAQCLIKFKQNPADIGNGLITSQQRTGKTRVSISYAFEVLNPGDTLLVIAGSKTLIDFRNELLEVERHQGKETFYTKIVKNAKSLDKPDKPVSGDLINARFISYGLFKILSPKQLNALLNVSGSQRVLVVLDELHLLRNFKTDQSQAIWNLINKLESRKVPFGVIGTSATIAAKLSDDIFGSMCAVNRSKINFKPYHYAFDLFKRYFYHVEETTFGLKTSALKRQDELRHVLSQIAVQTRQKELPLFKRYKRLGIKVELYMDKEQEAIYKEFEEYGDIKEGEDILLDSSNELSKLTRKQQLCITPSVVFSSYDHPSPKLKWVVNFILKNKFPIIVVARHRFPLNKLQDFLNALGIKTSYLKGGLSITQAQEEKIKFQTGETQVMLGVIDVIKENHTLPQAECTIFLDRSFTAGFNEQVEERMTPIDGRQHTKYVIDIVMKNTVEEGIYERLVIKKESINVVNDIREE